MRFYALVMYNLSPIQQGIQAAHAMAELSLTDCPRYKEWAKNWKTMIILNGGTSTDAGFVDADCQPVPIGTMQNHEQALKDLGVHYASFKEPDLNFATSALAFVLKESEYRKYEEWEYRDFEPFVGDTASKEIPISKFINNFRLA